jgi:hypothetical protein
VLRSGIAEQHSQSRLKRPAILDSPAGRLSAPDAGNPRDVTKRFALARVLLIATYGRAAGHSRAGERSPHGHAPDPKVAHWQERLEPLNKRLAGGCHLTRRISDSIEQAGFEVEHVDTYYFEGEPKPFGFTFEGRARKTERC